MLAVILKEGSANRAARLNDVILSMIQTPLERVFDQKYLVYCFRCMTIADRAPTLANVLRRQFGLPRRQLGQYERDIERNIHEQAIAGRKRPPIWRLWALARYALAKQRCAQVPLRIRFHAARRKWAARLRQVIGLGGHSR
ncbi:hypothetical protein [Burkholderia vietnamiensis]|uniref:hypothetical protein n=1 Tax=Burkholderia vietnamiensis TaxID=60552 RepID=UPI00075396F5|nr:hypothetical protein [Burkholderia vietnamiensis]KVE99158.1 hypothetical protein WJ03_14065 [Burkholderia vietnamiensis]